MAYVSISKDLTDSIRNTIHNLRAAELNSMASLDKFDEAVKNHAELKQWLVDRCWEPVQDLRDRLKEYDKKVNVSIEVQTTYVAMGYERTTKRDISIGELLLPCVTSTERNYYGDRKEFKLNVDDHEVFAPLREIMIARDECTQRWSAVERQVMDFVGKCKSLNEAVKLWPDLRRYIDREYTERLDKKVERIKPETSAAAAALKAMDVDLVNSSVVLARMAGAKV